MSLILTADSIEQEGGIVIRFPGSSQLSLDGAGIRSSTGATILMNTPGTLELSGEGGIRSSSESAVQLFPPSPDNTGITVSGSVSGYVTKPSQPTGLRATTKSSTQIDLEWISPENSSNLHFTVERSLDEKDWSTVVESTSSTTYSDTSDTGLTSGQTYYYRVSAINTAGTGPPSEPAVSATTWKLSTFPTSLSALTISSTQINVAWSPPELNGGTPILYYILEHALDNTETTEWSVLTQTQSPAERTYSHLALSEGTTHYYRVKAKNAVGTSDPSTVATTTTWKLPSEPTGLLARAVTATQIDLEWSAPLFNGGTEITSYTLEVTRDTVEPKTWSVVVEDTLIPSYNHGGLTTGTTYYYRVKAFNKVGAGPPTSEVTGSWALPKEPRHLSATLEPLFPSSQINLQWTPPEPNVDGAIVTKYHIERSLNNQHWTELAIVDSSTLFYSNSGLTSGTTYYYRVRAENEAGTGNNASNTATATTTGTLRLTATAISATQIDLEWSYDNLNTTEFGVERSEDNSTWTTIVETTTNRSYSDTPVSSSGKITFYYRVNTLGTSSSVASAKLWTVPGTPTISATILTSTSVKLSITPPEDDGGSPITGYVLKRIYEQKEEMSIPLSASTTTYTDTNVPNSRTFRYKLVAVNDVGSSTTPATAVVSLYGSGGTTTDIFLSATVISATQINLAWTLPDNSPILFTLERSTDSQVWTTILNNTLATSYENTSLTSGTTYFYRVFVQNSELPPSDVVSATTWMVPTAPSLSATVVSSTQIDLAWTVPTFDGGFSINSYTLEQSTDDVKWVEVATLSSRIYSHINLTPSTTYFYRVKATNSAGRTGPNSNTATLTTAIAPNEVQGSPQLDTCVASLTGIRLTWFEFGYVGSSYVVERSLNEQDWTVVAENLTALEYMDTNVVQGRYYSYRVKAVVVSLGTSDPSGVCGVLAWAPPNVPRDLSATLEPAMTASRINLEWTPPIPSLDGTSILHYYVERSLDNVAWTELATLGPSDYFYSNSGLTANTTYYYRVKAENEVGKTASNMATVTTSTLLTLTASAVSTTQIDLQWSVNDTFDYAGFRIERSEDNSTWTAVEDISIPSYSDTPVSSSSTITFYYRVSMLDFTNSVVNTSPVTSARLWTIPGTPAILGIQLTSTSIRLFVTPPVDDGGSQITGYTLKRFDTNIEEMSVDLSHTDTSYTDNTVTSNRTFSYRLFAINSVGSSLVPATVVMSTYGFLEPSVVALTATVVSSTQINLMWTVIDNTPITSYTLERSTYSMAWTTVINILNTSLLTTYSDTSLEMGTGYVYRVVAEDSTSTIHTSRIVSGVTWTIPSAPKLSVTDVSDSQVNLSWLPPDYNGGRLLTGYRLEQLSIQEWVTVSTFDASTTSYAHTGLLPSVTYTYRLFAINDVGENITTTESQVSAVTLSTLVNPSDTGPTGDLGPTEETGPTGGKGDGGGGDGIIVGGG